MQFITGRIVFIGNNQIINKSDGNFSSVIFAIKKRMNKKPRNIAFKCYGKLADMVLKMRIDDKVEVEYLIDSRKSDTEKWWTNLQARGVERIITEKKDNITSQLNFYDDDTN